MEDNSLGQLGALGLRYGWQYKQLESIKEKQKP